MGNLGGVPEANPPGGSYCSSSCSRARSISVLSSSPSGIVVGLVDLAQRLLQTLALLLDIVVPIREHLPEAQQQVGEPR